MKNGLFNNLAKLKIIIWIFFGCVIVAIGLMILAIYLTPATNKETPLTDTQIETTNNSSYDLSSRPAIYSISPSSTTSATPSASPVPSELALAPTVQATPKAPAPKSTTLGAKSTPVSNPIIYPLHTNILTTVFWAGEGASADNQNISNVPSAWYSNWPSHFGGVDSPTQRNGYWPSAFKPKENPFYFALPYGDYGDNGPKANTTRIYWYRKFSDGESILKNSWIAVTINGKTAYAQWEDVGPYEEDDVDYVFGSATPKDDVGLDISPAVRDFLKVGDQSHTSWRFIDPSQVPAGPWKDIVTTAGPSW